MSDDEVRVLVVDDLADAAEMLSMLLELNGYTVRTASDGEAALKAIEEWPPLCVILDIDMPGIDGLQLSTRLRRDHGDNIVLIAVTGAEKDDPRIAATFDLVDHYVRKPVDLKTLSKFLPPTRG